MLGSLKSPKAITLLEAQTKRLAKGTAPATPHLDILEAAKATGGGSLAKFAADYEATRAKLAPADSLPETEGGDAVGESIFRTSFTAQCIRCHKVGQAVVMSALTSTAWPSGSTAGRCSSRSSIRRRKSPTATG